MAKKPMTTEEKTRRQKKTKSVRHLAENIQSLRNKVTRDLKSEDEKTRLTALAIALMDKTASRVGNSESAKNGHFGVTGWRNKHVTVSGNTVTIKYVGKSGVDQEKQVTDATIAGMLKKCKGDCKGETPLLTTSDGISIKSSQVNRYLKDFGITAKDIRGYAANTLLVNALKSAQKSSDEKERQKKFREVMKSVAEKVGHQQATLKQHYLLPGIEEAYVKHSRIKEVKNASVGSRVASDMGLRMVARRVARWAVESIKEFDGPKTRVEAEVRDALKNWATQKH
jgi:DNA topoisomerase-1